MKKFVVLLLLLTTIRCEDEDDEEDEEPGSRCKREIVESYNLNGFLSKRHLNFYVCPAIKMSCCSMYDQFMMFTNWRDNVKEKLKKYYKGIEQKYKHMKALINEVFKINFNKLIEKLHMEEKRKDKIIQKQTFLKNKNIPNLIDKILELYHPNSEYMMKVRSTFYCSICDFDSHRFIDIPNKQVRISEVSCGEIAKNTINYSYYLNVELTRYLMDLSKVLVHFVDSDGAKPVVIRNAAKIRRDINKCANAFKNGGDNFKPCKKFCEHYKFNANSPIIEGYQVFFNDIINGMEMFLKANAEKEKDEKEEEEEESDEDDTETSDGTNAEKGKSEGGARLLSDNTKSTKDSDDDKENGSQQADIQTFNFSPAQLNETPDPYDEKAVDPNYDEYVLNKMFNFQKNYEKDRQQGYVNFIKNKLHFIDVEYDYENGDDNDIFKTNSHVIVDLEHFSTKVTQFGVNIEKHIRTTNMDKSMRDLVSHLKSRSRYKILYEKLDPALLKQINDITNDAIKNFHRDNFLKFKDESLMLKKEEMLKNYENVKKTAYKSGYKIY